jgi:hypothetical protein
LSKYWVGVGNGGVQTKGWNLEIVSLFDLLWHFTLDTIDSEPIDSAQVIEKLKDLCESNNEDQWKGNLEKIAKNLSKGKDMLYGISVP